MKLKHSFTVFGLVAMLGLGVGVGLASRNAPAKEAYAEAESKATTRIYIQDETGKGWTYSGADPWAYLEDITFTANSGYTSVSQITSAGFTYYNKFQIDNDKLIVGMQWVDGANRQYQIVVPWYIASFTAYFVGQNGSKTLKYSYEDSGNWVTGNRVEIEATAGHEYKIYPWDQNNDHCLWEDDSFATQVSIPDPDTYSTSVEKYAVTVSAGANGSVSPSGTANYFAGHRLTMTATPDQDYSFASWSDSILDASRTIIVASSGTYTASFNNLPKLSTPVLTKTNNVVTWSAVTNATKYVVQINSESPYDVLTSGPLSVAARIVPGSYTIHVTAIGDGENYSNSLTADTSYTVDAGYFLVGSFNSWNTATLEGAVRFVDGSISSIELAANAEVQAIYHDGSSVDWAGNVGGVIMDAEALIDYPVATHDDNIKFTNAGNYSIAIDFDGDDCSYTVEALDFTLSYKLYVGETEYNLVKQAGTEYKATGVNLTSGQILSYKRNDVAQDSTAKAANNNNLTSAKAVVFTTANADVYVDVSDGSIWTGQNASAGYHMMKNGALVTLTHGDDFDGFIQYYSSMISFEENDIIRFVDVSSNASTVPVVFDVTKINAGGLGGSFGVVDGKIKCSTECDATVYLKLKAGNDEIYFGEVSEDVRLAKEFAEDFTTAIGGVCVYQGGTPIEGNDGLAKAWQDQKTAFATLNTNHASAATVLTTALTEESSVAEIRAFIAMYIYVAEKYNTQLGAGYNFLGATLNIKPTTVINPITTAVKDNYLTVIIVSASVATLLLVGGYFYLRKRKEDR